MGYVVGGRGRGDVGRRVRVAGYDIDAGYDLGFRD